MSTTTTTRYGLNAGVPGGVKTMMAMLGLAELLIPLLILTGRVSVGRGLVGWALIGLVHAGAIETANAQYPDGPGTQQTVTA